MKKLTYILLFFVTTLYAQDDISASIFQDAKLAFIGDDKGNNAFTPNILVRVNLQCKQDKIGYGFIFPEFEYADLKGGTYTRYSLNGGYTFNKLVENVEISLTGGYGLIQRNSLSYRSLGFSGVLSYKIGRISPSLMIQGTDRADIGQFRTSVFFGLEYKLNRL